MMSETNGSGGGLARIDRLIASHQEILRALTITRDLLYGQATQQRAARQADVFAQAAALDAQRRGTSSARSVSEQRARSADFLAGFDRVTPRDLGSMQGTPARALIRRGYLKKKGDGYVRTSKPFSLTKPPTGTGKRGRPRKVHEQPGTPDATFKSKVAQQRAASAAFLAHFDPAEPRPSTVITNGNRRALGALVRRGYLKRKGEGYVRTAKPFEVEAAAAP